MKCVVQRVNKASVSAHGKVYGSISKGLLVFLGISDDDTEQDIKWLADKIIGLRIFEDENEKMNFSVKDVEGELLIISQFTLFGNCKKGKRPDFTAAGKPDFAKIMYSKFIDYCKGYIKKVDEGVFGADMKVELENDGPVTLIIDSKA
ncbi:MAG: D-tyrosyl-tRNA(Tyr) deacylase [Clostridia bacterium]|nr:D-tyrosyl-tRNA(Tyr) deacylase [Clostridia bacterium]